MSRPLSTQPGHAYAPGVDIPREPNPLVQALNDLLDIALPAILLMALLVVMLILWRIVAGILRRRNAEEREERKRQELIEQLEAEARNELNARKARNPALQQTGHEA